MSELTEIEEQEKDVDDEDEPRDRASIIIISDFVCPWCYIGLGEVERLREEYDLDVHFAPFYLHPETPAGGMPSRHVTAPDAPQTPIEQRAEALGLTFSRGRAWTSNSHLAFQAGEFAEEYGDRWRFQKRMLKAYFEDLEDIGDIDTLVRIGTEAGIDGKSLREALLDRRYSDHVDQGIEWSRSIGVTAVPTFIFNERYGMVGAHELPMFRQMMEKIGQPRKA